MLGRPRDSQIQGSAGQTVYENSKQIQVCVHACMCIWVWRPQASATWLSLCCPPSVFWSRVSYWTWNLLIQLKGLAGKPRGSACLKVSQYKHATLYCFLFWMLGIEVRSMLTQQAFWLLSHHPNSPPDYYCNFNRSSFAKFLTWIAKIYHLTASSEHTVLEQCGVSGAFFGVSLHKGTGHRKM